MAINDAPGSQTHRHMFVAMGSPCEVQIECDDPALATRLGQIAEAEARRIEAKYSRYRADSLISQINASAGEAVAIDPETSALFDYADQCHRLSGGKFDITSGVLRRIWKFDGSDNIPSKAEVAALLPLIGWDKILRKGDSIRLRDGMEIDLGGLGKEYAVDCATLLIAHEANVPALINFGGDLRVTGPRLGGRRWHVAIESVEETGGTDGWLELMEGALTTSGDARRYLMRDGVRYAHILDPRKGFPVRNPPRSVTVAAPTCMEAGILSTLAMLQGARAEQFLAREAIQSWVAR